MLIQPFNVIAWLCSGDATIPYRAPTLKLNEHDSVPSISIDYDGADEKRNDAKAFYPCTKVVSDTEDGIALCSPEINRHVELALQGHNTAIILLDVGGVNADDAREKIVYQTVTQLNLELDKANTQRRRENLHNIQLDYVHFGIVDNCCYDLKSGERIDNNKILNNGLEKMMKRMNQKDSLWSKIKKTSTDRPSVLCVRLVDPSKLLGRLFVVDMRQPNFKRDVGIKPSNSLYYSFARLRELFRSFSKDNKSIVTEHKINPSDISSCVLCKLIGPFLCGLGSASIFMHFNITLDYDVDDTIEALQFMSELSSMGCISIPNEPDIRVRYFKWRLANVQKELDTKEKDITTRYQAQLKACQDELRKKSLGLEQITRRLQQSIDQQEKYQKQLEEAIKCNEESLTKTETIANEHGKANLQKQKLNDKLTHAREMYENARKQTEILSLRHALRSAKADLEAAKLRASLAHLEKIELAKKLDLLEQEFDDRRKELQEMKKTIAEMEMHNEESDERIIAYKTLIQKLKTKFRNEGEKQLVDWKEKEIQYQKQIQMMEKDMIEATQILVDVEEEKRIWHQEKDELLSVLADKTAACTELQNELERLQNRIHRADKLNRKWQEDIQDYKERWEKEAEWNKKECAAIQAERQRMRLYVGHLKHQVSKGLNTRSVDELLSDADKVAPSIEASYIQTVSVQDTASVAISPSDLVRAGKNDIEMGLESDGSQPNSNPEIKENTPRDQKFATMQSATYAASADTRYYPAVVNENENKQISRIAHGNFSVGSRSSAISGEQDKRPFALEDTLENPSTPSTPVRSALQSIQVNMMPNKRRRIDGDSRKINKQ